MPQSLCINAAVMELWYGTEMAALAAVPGRQETLCMVMHTPSDPHTLTDPEPPSCSSHACPNAASDLTRAILDLLEESYSISFWSVVQGGRGYNKEKAMRTSTGIRSC